MLHAGFSAVRQSGFRGFWDVVLLERRLGFVPSLREANGSRECAPDDRLRDEAIQFFGAALDCVAEPVNRRRFAPTGRFAATHVGEKRDNMISEESNDV
jgi:hypothetical protein